MLHSSIPDHIGMDTPFCRSNNEYSRTVCHAFVADRQMFEERWKWIKSTKFEKTSCTRNNTKAHDEGDDDGEAVEFDPISIWIHPELWSWWGHILNDIILELPICPVPCTVTFDQHHATIVLTQRILQVSKSYPTQKRAVAATEPFPDFNKRLSRETAYEADYLMSYSRFSEVPITYFYALTGDHDPLRCERNESVCISSFAPTAAELMKEWNEKENENEKKVNNKNSNESQPSETAFSALFVSNSVAKYRAAYLTELSKYIPLDSFGQFLHTPGLPSGHSVNKATILSNPKYKFHLAFENAPFDDYVSEKFFDAFMSNSLPVYWGAPNVDEYAPAPYSFINVFDFPSPKALAAYLRYLATDPVAYARYFAWKQQAASETLFNSRDDNPQQLHRVKQILSSAYHNLRLQSLSNKDDTSFVCRLCQAHYERYCNNSVASHRHISEDDVKQQEVEPKEKEKKKKNKKKRKRATRKERCERLMSIYQIVPLESYGYANQLPNIQTRWKDWSCEQLLFPPPLALCSYLQHRHGIIPHVTFGSAEQKKEIMDYWIQHKCDMYFIPKLVRPPLHTPVPTNHSCMNDITLATAVNSRFFSPLLNALGSLHVHQFDGNTATRSTQRIIVWDLGLTFKQRTYLTTLCHVTVRAFNFSAYPTFVAELYHYAWKPLALAETFHVYPDTSCCILV